MPGLVRRLVDTGMSYQQAQQFSDLSGSDIATPVT